MKDFNKFQFQDGSIISTEEIKSILGSIKFQFQDGSIIRNATTKDFNEIIKFQFQDGSIISVFLAAFNYL